jgi:hypothetical protein
MSPSTTIIGCHCPDHHSRYSTESQPQREREYAGTVVCAIVSDHVHIECSI